MSKKTNFNDIVGTKIGNFVVLEIDKIKLANTSHNGKPIVNKKVYYKCMCDCGVIESVRREVLLDPNSEKMCKYCKAQKRKNKFAYDKNIINNIFGDFKVVSFDHKDNYGTYFFNCECIKCGNTIIKSRGSLIAKRDCECLKCKSAEKINERINNIIGQKFGKLTVISLNHRDEANRINFYNCKCECGHDIVVRQPELLNGTKNSCSLCQKNNIKNNLINDIVGQRFGKLFVVSVNKVLDDSRVYYNCICDCGHKDIRERRYIKNDPNPCCSECAKINKYGDMRDIINKRIGKLTVIDLGKKVGTAQYYKCKCECGNKVERLRIDLINGRHTACRECLAKEAAIISMSDIINKKFGSLTVISIEGKHDNGAYYYNCKCDCGNEVIKERRLLMTGKAENLKCPECKTKSIAEDMIGKEFNNLKVLYFDHTNKYGAIYYKCLCKLCNKTFDAERQAIKNGITKQCYECTKLLREKNFQEKLNELIEKKFGKLTVLSVDHKDDNGNYFYKCKCDCGNYVLKNRLDLLNGKSLQCQECYYREKLQKEIDECINMKFGRLTVVSFAGLKDTNKEGEHEILYNCKCDCGGTKEGSSEGGWKVVSKKDLKSGAVKSCGCLYFENLDKLHTETNVKHGMWNTPLYQCYYDMLQRCYNPNNARYHRYGGRGITVCDEWLGENGFINFKNDMGKSYDDHNAKYNNDTQLNRIDNNLGYSKHNCTWSTNLENSCNQEKSYRYCYNGYWYTAGQIQYFIAPYYSMEEILSIIQYYGLKNGDSIHPNMFMPATDTSPIKFIK